VNHTVDFWVFGEHGIEGSLIGNVNVVVGWTSACDEFNAIDAFLGRVVTVVDYHDSVSSTQELDACEGANVAGTSAEKRVRMQGQDYME
jgi:hypothetical protein